MRILSRMNQLSETGRVFIYGAGGAGLALKRRMEESGAPDAAFIDSFGSGELQGTRVYSLAEYLADRQPGDAIVIASTYAVQIADGLKERGIFDYFIYLDTSEFLLSRAVCDRLPSESTFQLLDIGARDPLSQPFWAPLDEARLRIHGFEPDEKECAFINEIFSDSPLSLTCHPVALWSEPGEVPFWYCERTPENSSVYPPDFHYHDRFRLAEEGVSTTRGSQMRPVRRMSMRATTLDDWAAAQRPGPMDFAKLDTQGSELDILKGGWTVARDLLGLVLEASFIESYEGRPLFADVDAALRGHGFHFFDFYRNTLSGWLIPGSRGMHPDFGTRFQRFPETDVLYFKDPIREEHLGLPMDGWTSERLFKLAALADACNQSYFGLELLQWAEGFLERQGDHPGAEAAGSLYGALAPRYADAYPDFAAPRPDVARE